MRNMGFGGKETDDDDDRMDRAIRNQDALEAARWQSQWTNTFEPQWQKYSTGLQRELQTAFDRSYADAQGKLGYSLNATGSGEGGAAEASRLALTTEAQNKRADISQRQGQTMQQAYVNFMTTKNIQQFEMEKLAAQQAFAKEMAEMNQPSWWGSLGSIVGMGLGLLLAAPTGGVSLGMGAAAGGIVGGGVGNAAGVVSSQW